jgi:hypothetical protein
MKVLLGALVTFAALAASAAGAQEALTLTVRPSGLEVLSAPARQREAMLQRRMEEVEFLFRNICDRCGGPDRPGANAPFDPIATLRAPRR